MIAISLQSGSSGNAVYVEAGSVRLLFDAGISGALARDRLALHGRNIGEVDGVVISHDHADHVRSAGVYQRMFHLPLYVTAKTLQAACRYQNLGRLNADEVRHFHSGQALCFDGVCVETIPTAHDGADGVGFVIDDGKTRLGILTDLGHPFRGLDRLVGTLDAVVIESNFDPDMLENGPYPYYLKERVRGPSGHLSNFEAGELLKANLGGRLRWACLGHLSENNNTPKLALETCRELTEGKLPLCLASRDEVSGVMEV